MTQAGKLPTMKLYLAEIIVFQTSNRIMLYHFQKLLCVVFARLMMGFFLSQNRH